MAENNEASLAIVAQAEEDAKAAGLLAINILKMSLKKAMDFATAEATDNEDPLFRVTFLTLLLKNAHDVTEQAALVAFEADAAAKNAKSAQINFANAEKNGETAAAEAYLAEVKKYGLEAARNAKALKKNNNL